MLVHPATVAHGVRNRDGTMSRSDSTHLFHELHGLFPSDGPDGADLLVVEQDTVEFICRYKHLGPEGRRDELCGGRKFVDHSYGE